MRKTNGGVLYTPTALKGRRFAVTPHTQAGVSRAEVALVRLEDKAEDCEVRAALHRVLTRLESVSSIRIEGKRPSLRAVIKAESLLDFCDDSSVQRLNALDALDFVSEDEWATTLEVAYNELAVERIYRAISPGAAVTPELLLDIHAISRFGRRAHETGTRLRTAEYDPSHAHDNRTPYRPPAPADIPGLLGDLCAFINQEIYSPITQTAIAHFQYEGIKPFKTGLDKSGRLLSHVVIHRRNLAQRLIAPIGLEPAIDTRTHAQALLPYNFGATLDEQGMAEALDRWVAFCAHSLEVSVQAADACLDAILGLRDTWIERFGRPNKGSALGGLLNLMVGQPVLTVRQAVGLLGKSVSSVNEALLRLEDAGIVASAEGLQRNRIYVAHEAVEVLESLEQAMIPHGPVARDSVRA